MTETINLFLVLFKYFIIIQQRDLTGTREDLFFFPNAEINFITPLFDIDARHDNIVLNNIVTAIVSTRYKYSISTIVKVVEYKNQKKKIIKNI